MYCQASQAIVASAFSFQFGLFDAASNYTSLSGILDIYTDLCTYTHMDQIDKRRLQKAPH